MPNRTFMSRGTKASRHRARKPIFDNPRLVLCMDHPQACIITEEFRQTVPLQQVNYAFVYEVKLKAACVPLPVYEKARHAFIQRDTTNWIASEITHQRETVARSVLQCRPEPHEGRV
jgi:hypothetical protein